MINALAYFIVFAPLILIFIYAAVRLATVAYLRSTHERRKNSLRVWQEHNKEN